MVVLRTKLHGRLLLDSNGWKRKAPIMSLAFPLMGSAVTTYSAPQCVGGDEGAET